VAAAGTDYIRRGFQPIKPRGKVLSTAKPGCVGGAPRALHQRRVRLPP